MKILVAIHRHRHGEDVYLYNVEDFEDFAEEDVIEMLGDQFEEDREEYIYLYGPYSASDIKQVKPTLGRG